MYSMVLMAAMLPSGDTAAFGKHKGGCTGSCTGTVMSAGCTGSCHGGSGFLGLHKSNSCSGGGFLGHKNSCSGGGFLGHKSKGSCHGTPAPACGCCGGGAAAASPPPVAMPKPMDPKVDPKPKAKTTD
jgi:hypothetical protein